MIHETVGTVSTLGTKVSTPPTSKTLENDSNLANSDFSIGSFPREGRSQATPDVIQETFMSASASSSKSLVGTESVVEKSMSIDASFGSLPKGNDFRKPKTPVEFLSKTPRSLNKSQPKQPTMEIPSPKVTRSQPTKQVDDDDLFNFEEEEEEEDGDKEKTKSKRKRSVSTEQEATSHSKRTKVQATATTTAADKPEPKKEWKSNPGKFLSKSSLSPKSLSIDSATNKVVDEEISRSFMTLEVRPLILVKTNSSLSDISSNASYSNNNKKNVKTFKKQVIAKPNRSIPCTISVTSSVANLGTLENAMEITAQVEENQETRAAPSRRPNQDPEEDIWNFEDSPEQRPASRKRKR